MSTSSEIEKAVDELFDKDKIRKLTPMTSEQIKKTAVLQVAVDAIKEKHEAPDTSNYCPESVTEDQMDLVRKNPENYLEINIVKETRVIDSFFIPGNLKSFTYKNKSYDIVEDSAYLLPGKAGVLMPTSYYHEKHTAPTSFKQKNKGITGKALSLLYMEPLYTNLLYSEDFKYNFFIVILCIVTLICYGIGCYFVFFHNGGILKNLWPHATPPPISFLRWF